MRTQHSDTVTVNQTLKKGILTALWRFLYRCYRDASENTYFFLLMLEKMPQLLQVCLSLVAYICCLVPHVLTFLTSTTTYISYTEWFSFTDSQKVLSSKKSCSIWMQLAYRSYLSQGVSPYYSYSLPISISIWYLLRDVCTSPSAASIPSYKALQNHPKQSSNVPLLCADHMAISNDLSISHFCVISLMWGHFGSSQLAGSSG